MQVISEKYFFVFAVLGRDQRGTAKVAGIKTCILDCLFCTIYIKVFLR